MQTTIKAREIKDPYQIHQKLFKLNIAILSLRPGYKQIRENIQSLLKMVLSADYKEVQ